MDMTYRLKVNKDSEDINNTTDQGNVIGTYKTLSLKAAEDTFSRKDIIYLFTNKTN